MPTMAAKTKNQPLDYQSTNHKMETLPPTITTTTTSTPPPCRINHHARIRPTSPVHKTTHQRVNQHSTATQSKPALLMSNPNQEWYSDSKGLTSILTSKLQTVTRTIALDDQILPVLQSNLRDPFWKFFGRQGQTMSICVTQPPPMSPPPPWPPSTLPWPPWPALYGSIPPRISLIASTVDLRQLLLQPLGLFSAINNDVIPLNFPTAISPLATGTNSVGKRPSLVIMGPATQVGISHNIGHMLYPLQQQLYPLILYLCGLHQGQRTPE